MRNIFDLFTTVNVDAYSKLKWRYFIRLTKCQFGKKHRPNRQTICNHDRFKKLVHSVFTFPAYISAFKRLKNEPNHTYSNKAKEFYLTTKLG